VLRHLRKPGFTRETGVNQLIKQYFSKKGLLAGKQSQAVKAGRRRAPSSRAHRSTQ
jgi:hypothetical protein